VNYLQAEAQPILGDQYFPAIIDLIRNAKRSIDVLQYTWSWRQWERNNCITQITTEVMRAKQRGVTVRVVFNIESQNHAITHANQRTLKKIGSVGVESKTTRTTPTLHAKLIIVDNELVLLGSHNLSGRSLLSNYETSVIIRSVEVAKIYKDYFNIIWKTY
jgi:phosphatidylserine/phosphatidylglycerophosphate/cardiolipin synthase-like enzyme